MYTTKTDPQVALEFDKIPKWFNWPYIAPLIALVDFLGLLLYHCPYDVFIARPICHCVMCVCRIPINITYLLNYLLN